MNINPAFIRRESSNFVSNRQVNIGFVVLAQDKIFQSDIESAQASGVSLSFVRLNSQPAHWHININSTDTIFDDVRRATVDIPSTRDLDVVFLASGLLSLQLGNERVLNAIQVGAPDALVSSIYTATKRALRAIKAKRVCVATDHSHHQNLQITDAFHRAGVNVVNIKGLRDYSRASASRISPKDIKNFALSLDRADADAIVICSTNIRAMEVIEEIEQWAGKPVICSNQVALWDTLRSAGVVDKISGYGSLLRQH